MPALKDVGLKTKHNLRLSSFTCLTSYFHLTKQQGGWRGTLELSKSISQTETTNLSVSIGRA